MYFKDLTHMIACWKKTRGDVAVLKSIGQFRRLKTQIRFTVLRENSVSFGKSQVKWSEVKVAQSCPALCDPKDYKVHGILQARILDG